MKERGKGNNGGEEKAKNGEGMKAWPHPHKIMICHCSDKARVGSRPPAS